MSVTVMKPNDRLNELWNSMLPKAEKSTEECKDHEFVFVPCVGTFCVHCNLPFGVECLHPECKVHNCQTHMLVYSAFEEKTYGDVLNEMTDDTYVVHLGHDGVTKGTNEEVRKLMSFPNLKVLEYCGYYTDKNVEEILSEEQYQDRINPIF